MRTWETYDPDDTYIFKPMYVDPPRRRRWPRLRALLSRHRGQHTRKAAGQ